MSPMLRDIRVITDAAAIEYLGKIVAPGRKDHRIEVLAQFQIDRLP